MKRLNLATGSPWEDRFGYSRAVRLGNQLEISGTVAVDEHGHVAFPGDAYAQTRHILARVGTVLQQAGFEWGDVVRTRMFVTNMAFSEEVGRAHGEVFGAIKPATSMLEVSALIDPGYLVEIEVTAISSKATAQLV